MKQRIQDLKTTNTSDGKEVYTSSKPSSVNIELTDIVVTADEVTRLDLIAHRYLGDRDLWWMIASANGITNGSMHCRPGQELVIPISERRRL